MKRRLGVLIMVLGLTVGTIGINVRSAGTWMSEVTAGTICVDNNATLSGTIKNDEPATTAGTIIFRITDAATGKSVEQTVAGQTKVDWEINTGSQSTTSSHVTVEQRWADGRTDTHPAYPVSYGAIDCTPAPVAPSGTTSATQHCDTATGSYVGEVELSNNGEVDFTITSTDLPGITPWEMRAATADKKPFTFPGDVSRSSYQLVAVTAEGEQVTLDGVITPGLDGNCEAIHPPVVVVDGPIPNQPPVTTTTTTTSPPPAQVTKHPHTGPGPITTMLIVLGFGALLFGGIAAFKGRTPKSVPERI